MCATAERRLFWEVGTVKMPSRWRHWVTSLAGVDHPYILIYSFLQQVLLSTCSMAWGIHRWPRYSSCLSRSLQSTWRGKQTYPWIRDYNIGQSGLHLSNVEGSEELQREVLTVWWMWFFFIVCMCICGVSARWKNSEVKFGIEDEFWFKTWIWGNTRVFM